MVQRSNARSAGAVERLCRMADNEPTAVEYREYLALAEKATAGPMEVVKGCFESEGEFWWCQKGKPLSSRWDSTLIHERSDAEFYAASRRIGPAAVRRMLALEAALKEIGYHRMPGRMLEIAKEALDGQA